MCYEWGEAGAYHGLKQLAQLDTDVVLRTVDECLPFKPSFELFGGEPLLYQGIWDVIGVISGGGCDLAFPTNGTLLEEHAEHLVGTPPTQVWVSIDGPQEINDLQRGRGVFGRAMGGVSAVARAKRRLGRRLPELGVTYVVTPLNTDYIAQFFLEVIDLALLSSVSIELQSYTTEAQHDDYARVARDHFGVGATPCAQAYVRDPAMFAGVDPDSVSQQVARVRRASAERGVRFFSQPRSMDAANIGSYLRGDWAAMADHHSRCAVPWTYAEISARGDVNTCHSFYDIAVGNIYEQSLLEIWRGERLRHLRDYLREQLFSICTACCRYYSAPSTPVALGVKAN
jgi:radical SAM protein with 4Fe4S-binding SPASM domain